MILFIGYLSLFLVMHSNYKFHYLNWHALVWNCILFFAVWKVVQKLEKRNKFIQLFINCLFGTMLIYVSIDNVSYSSLKYAPICAIFWIRCAIDYELNVILLGNIINLINFVGLFYLNKKI